MPAGLPAPGVYSWGRGGLTPTSEVFHPSCIYVRTTASIQPRTSHPKSFFFSSARPSKFQRYDLHLLEKSFHQISDIFLLLLVFFFLSAIARSQNLDGAHFATSASVYLPFALLRFFLSRSALRSLSSLSFVMITFDGRTPTCTVWPFALSRVTRSTWTTHFLR